MDQWFSNFDSILSNNRKSQITATHQASANARFLAFCPDALAQVGTEAQAIATDGFTRAENEDLNDLFRDIQHTYDDCKYVVEEGHIEAEKLKDDAAKEGISN